MHNQQHIELPEDSAYLLRGVECLKEYILKHGDRTKAFVILKALTDLTIERLTQGKDAKLTAYNLHMEVIGPTADETKSSAWLSNIWKTLEDRMLEREQGLQEYAAEQGLSSYAWPEKDKSPGGAGITSYYFLKSKMVNKDVTENIDLKPLKPDEIRYIRELTPAPAWWARGFLRQGYILQGWRKWLLISYGLIIVLLVGAFILGAWFTLGYSKNLSTASLFQIVLIVTLVTWCGWSLLGPFVKLLDWRIIMAPDILVSFKESNVQLELIRESGRRGIIRLVRYAANCPICDGKILLTDGKKDYQNRLVGRCEESPAEHVYSFDRTSLIGKPLL